MMLTHSCSVLLPLFASKLPPLFPTQLMMTQLGYSLNVKANGDRVQLYTGGAINQTAQLTRGGMILIAILHGGDYDMVNHGNISIHVRTLILHITRMASEGVASKSHMALQNMASVTAYSQPQTSTMMMVPCSWIFLLTGRQNFVPCFERTQMATLGNSANRSLTMSVRHSCPLKSFSHTRIPSHPGPTVALVLLPYHLSIFKNLTCEGWPHSALAVSDGPQTFFMQNSRACCGKERFLRCSFR